MIRFSTTAANADVLGEDTAMAEPRRDRVKPRQDCGGDERRDARRADDGDPESGAAKSGQDINASGFVKDGDAVRPK